MPGTGKALHHFPDQGDGSGIVQWGKDYGLIQILEYFIGDSLVPVQSRSGMHHAIAHRVDCRHTRPAKGTLQQIYWMSRGIGFGWVAQLPAAGIAKGEFQLPSAHPADLAGEEGAWPGRPATRRGARDTLEN
jgi:hypothetical protein